MKRSISTLAPQRPTPVARLCNAALDRTPASQAAPHRHHRCHGCRDRKLRSLEKGSASANGRPLLPTSGASTSGRGGRRQLPQTLLTLRPSIAYKRANSSPVHFAGAQTNLPAFSPGLLSRGLSEHNALLQRDPLSQPLAPSTRIGSDRYLGRRLDSEAAARTQPEDTLTFEEAVATNSGRSSRTSYVSSLTSQSHPLRRVPNGYHCTLRLSSGGGGRGGTATTTPTKTTGASCTATGGRVPGDEFYHPRWAPGALGR
ncbi:voltage-dependent N-type calcium channel subunit alpha-1B [Pontoporia blainvillei]|uniref:Voltage-dependent N-type calcium channel subunit alpha-1B n=1 Tax=Pontoporia blainvillei TaxID=48723 RepID=A0ABX0S9J0_PONBL|nr:voltage-dependent N-type calcium channel subunit alpha-1B [Pontoporia blainvillei]